MPCIEQDGNCIYYARLAGDGDGSQPVILHHGMAQWSDDWLRAGWLDAMPGRAVYALDALGHGRSGRPADRTAYSVEKRAETVLRLADAEGLEKFSFFGFSMGGRVGFELAAEHPVRIDRLIVGGMHGLKPSIDRRNLERRTSVLRSSKWRLVERAVGARPDDGRNNDPEALAVSTEAVLDWRGADDRLPSFSTPAMIFCGVQDSLLPYARQTAALLPGCRFLELDSTGHAASFYSSEQARQGVRRFLSDE